MKKNIILPIILFLSYSVIYGQISTREAPMSFRMELPNLQRTAETTKSFASLDLERLRQEDKEYEAAGMPPRFGYRHRVNYNLENSGEWTVLPNGDRLWRLNISCEGAKSINLLYDKFWIPEGAKFWIHSNDRRHSIGAFTSENNRGTRENPGKFATGIVYGNQIILEYFLPKDVKDVGAISIVYVVHGYRSFVETMGEEIGWFGSATPGWHRNINCPQGQNWQREKNAVALILVDGYRLCSGFLINTTANDGRPLFMTANHCLPGYDAMGNANLEHTIFRWHYESPECNDVFTPLPPSLSGATLFANSYITDFALLWLTEDPRHPNSGIVPYYLGWSRSNNPGTGDWVGIHHPRGDVKKISTANQVQNHPRQIIWTDQFGNVTSITPPNTHWAVSFFDGTTEGGSSGSPVLNSARRVIGQLHGGTRGPAPITKYYGRFDVSWTGNNAPQAQRRLRDWLDPHGTNAMAINGLSRLSLASDTDVACYGATAFFSVQNLSQSGFDVQWEPSSPNIAINPSGTSATVGRGSSLPLGRTYLGQVIANVKTLQGNIPVARLTRNIIVGTRPAAQFISSINDWQHVPHSEFVDVITYGGLGIITANNPFGISMGQWQMIQGGGVSITSVFSHPVDVMDPVYGARAGLMASLPGENRIQVSLQNHCGWSDWQTLTYLRPPPPPPVCPICFGFDPWCPICQDNPPCFCGIIGCTGCFPWDIFSPNPVSDVLTIDLSSKTQREARTCSCCSSRAVPDVHFDIRLLNAQGVIVRQQRASSGQIQFDVSQLPEGTYYLHIEHNGEIQKHQIIVNRK